MRMVPGMAARAIRRDGLKPYQRRVLDALAAGEGTLHAIGLRIPQGRRPSAVTLESTLRELRAAGLCDRRQERRHGELQMIHALTESGRAARAVQQKATN